MNISVFTRKKDSGIKMESQGAGNKPKAVSTDSCISPKKGKVRQALEINDPDGI